MTLKGFYWFNNDELRTGSCQSELPLSPEMAAVLQEEFWAFFETWIV